MKGEFIMNEKELLEISTTYSNEELEDICNFFATCHEYLVRYSKQYKHGKIFIIDSKFSYPTENHYTVSATIRNSMNDLTITQPEIFYELSVKDKNDRVRVISSLGSGANNGCDISESYDFIKWIKLAKNYH
jgi:hypothetical protein